MTENAAPQSNTLHMKKTKKPSPITEGKTRGQVKTPSSDAAPSQPPPPPKKPKDFRLQYKAKPGTPMEKSHGDWKHLDAFYKLEHAQGVARTKMNGNALNKMFDYRILDKDNKECPLQ